MKPAITDRALNKFYLAELIRFYDSQTKQGKKYLEDTLEIWRQNAKYGDTRYPYAEAVRRITGRKNDSSTVDT
jgi:hypothetical protein